MLSESINQIASKFSINTAKPFFPVNTMRLYYLVLADGFSQSNQETLEKTNTLIPLISQLLDIRDLGSSEASYQEMMDAAKPAVSEMEKLMDASAIYPSLHVMFADSFPLQDTLLASINMRLKQEALDINDLATILRIRAMDSLLYSSLIMELLRPHIPSEALEMPGLIHIHINQTLQLNDMADAIIHAQEDLKVGSATIVDVIKKIVPSTNINETVKTALERLQKPCIDNPLPESLQKNTLAYQQALVDCILKPAAAQSPTPPVTSQGSTPPSPANSPTATPNDSTSTLPSDNASDTFMIDNTDSSDPQLQPTPTPPGLSAAEDEDMILPDTVDPSVFLEDEETPENPLQN